MTLKDLLRTLKDIESCHPEASDAEVWAVKGKSGIHIKWIGYDCSKKPARIKLGE